MNRNTRMEEKKAIRKKKRNTILGLLMLVFFLILGLVATDYALRDMMALFDGDQLFAYSKEMNIHYFHLMGEEFYIDQQVISSTLLGYVDWTRGKIAKMLYRVKNING